MVRSIKKDKILIDTLNLILYKAKDHPCFDIDIFNTKDWERLMDEGGDMADWTGIALKIEEALEAYGK